MKALATLLWMCAALNAVAQDTATGSIGQRLANSSCAQCHSFAKGEGHGVGPNLFALLGRPAAAAEGFAFSKPYVDAMKGKTWDRALLERWLTDSQVVAPGNGMVYFQDDPKKRAELINYLESLK
jgi:cytochrome c